MANNVSSSESLARSSEVEYSNSSSSSSSESSIQLLADEKISCFTAARNKTYSFIKNHKLLIISSLAAIALGIAELSFGIAAGIVVIGVTSVYYAIRAIKNCRATSENQDNSNSSIPSFNEVANDSMPPPNFSSSTSGEDAEETESSVDESDGSIESSQQEDSMSSVSKSQNEESDETANKTDSSISEETTEDDSSVEVSIEQRDKKGKKKITTEDESDKSSSSSDESSSINSEELDKQIEAQRQEELRQEAESFIQNGYVICLLDGLNSEVFFDTTNEEAKERVKNINGNDQEAISEIKYYKMFIEGTSEEHKNQFRKVFTERNQPLASVGCYTPLGKKVVSFYANNTNKFQAITI